MSKAGLKSGRSKSHRWYYRINLRPWGFIPLVVALTWLAWEGAFTKAHYSATFGSIPFWILLFILLLPIVTQLEVKSHSEYLAYRFIPFIPIWKRLKWKEVESARIIERINLSGFGGWGLRFLGGDDKGLILPFYSRVLEIKTRKGHTLYLSYKTRPEIETALNGLNNLQNHE